MITETETTAPGLFLMTPQDPPKGWEKKYGYYAIAENGDIFIPGIVTGRSEMEMLLCASYDGEPLMHTGGGRKGVALFRADWLKAEAPKAAQVIERIVARIHELSSTPH